MLIGLMFSKNVLIDSNDKKSFVNFDITDNLGVFSHNIILFIFNIKILNIP